jgi:hypothetical protein
LVCGDTYVTGSKVFRGAAFEVSFSNWLHKTVQALSAEEALLLGSAVEDIGTHSIRKGTGTAANSQPGGPSATSVRLRMDHTLGGVEDRYIYEGEGSDQLLGEPD